jgi:hypothetical protein
MACSGCSGPISLVFSPGVVGRDTVSTTTALVPAIYDASTRAVVIDSMGWGRCQQLIQVPQHAQSWRRRRDVRLNDTCGGSEQQLGPHQWSGRCLALRAQAQWLSSVNPNLWVRWEYARRRCRLQQRTTYGWTGHKSGSGFSDLAPSILHYNWF